VLWLFGPYFLFILSFGGTIVPKINLIVELACRRYYADRSITTNPADPASFFGQQSPECLQPAVQQRVTSLTLAINLVIGLLSALVVPLVGAMSDRHGRIKLMALSACGGIASEIVTIIAGKFPDVVDYRIFILGAVFEGLAGSFTAGMVLGNSYISDCTPPSRRGVAIGTLHACIFTGMALGPVLSGFIIKATGSMLSIFYIVLGCHVSYALFLLLVVPEALSEQHRQESRDKHAAQRHAARSRGPLSWLASLKDNNPLAPLAALVPRGAGASPQLRRNIIALAGIDASVMVSLMSAWPVIILYTEYQFHWGNLETSILLSTISSLRVVVLMGILPAVNYFVRIRPARKRAQEQAALGMVPHVPHEKNVGTDSLDIWLIRIGIAFDVVATLGYGLSTMGPMFFISGTFTAVGGLSGATTQAAVSKHVPPHKVGQLLGAIGLLHGLGRMAAPLLFSGMYYATVATHPSAVFFLMCGIFSLALMASFLVRPGVYLAHVDDDDSDTTESESEDGGNLAEREPLMGEEIWA
jgi:MFS family permease